MKVKKTEKKNTETDLHQLEENMNNYWHERKCEFILRFVHIIYVPKSVEIFADYVKFCQSTLFLLHAPAGLLLHFQSFFLLISSTLFARFNLTSSSGL